MRVALLLAALALNTCTTARGVEEPVQMQTVTQGSYAASEERQAVLASSEADFRKSWQTLVGEGDVPAVDFEKHVAVFLMGGMRNTGGWSVVPESVRVEGDTAVITAKVQGPPPGAMTTQALTYPYAVVAIDSREIRQVRWE